MATFQTLRNSHMKTRASVRKSFSEDVFQSVKSLLQSEKELCTISAEDCLKQDEHANLTEVTFLGFNEETDAAHIQDLAAVSVELPDLLNSLHFCSLNENEIICMKDISKSSDTNSGPLNQSQHSGMLCVMRVSPTLPRLRIDFIFSLLSKYATGIRYTLDTYLHQKHQLETAKEDDDDDTNQSVSSIEDDFVTAFEHLEEEEASKPYNDGINITALKSQCDAASQTSSGHHLETHDLRILVSSGRQKSLANPSASLINVLGHKELPSVKTSVTTLISEPWIQKSFYRSSNASDKAHSITRDVKKELTTSTVGLPKSLTDSCLYEKSGCDEDTKSHIEPEFLQSLQPPSQNHRFYHSTGNLNGYGHGENVVQAIEQYAKKVVDDTLELSLGSAVFHESESTKAADRVTYAEKLSPLISQACRYCDRKELHDCTGNSSQHISRLDSFASGKPVSVSKLSNIHQESRICHLDVPQIHVGLDKKTVLAEKIVAEAIEKAERELSNTSLAADSGIGQDGISFVESLTTEIMTSAMTNVGRAVSSPKEIEDLQSTESFGSQQMNLSIGDDSTGSWSNLSFEDEHQDESSSFHHLSESDEPDDKDEDPEDDGEGLGPDRKILLITNIDMEPCTVDPQLRIILQWLVASEAEVTELYLHDSAKKEFIQLSKRLQEKGWKVGDVVQAVLQYYEVQEERHKSLFDWLLEDA